MAIANDEELKEAAAEAGNLLQQIQDYCDLKHKNEGSSKYPEEAKVGFPNRYIRKASEQRARLGFLRETGPRDNLLKNVSYHMMAIDTINWLLVRTTLWGQSKEMMVKVLIFMTGAVYEASLNRLTHGWPGSAFASDEDSRKKGVQIRAKALWHKGYISEDLMNGVCEMWELRNNMHLAKINKKEDFTCDYHTQNYNDASLLRSRKIFKRFLEELSEIDNQCFQGSGALACRDCA